MHRQIVQLTNGIVATSHFADSAQGCLESRFCVAYSAELGRVRVLSISGRISQLIGNQVFLSNSSSVYSSWDIHGGLLMERPSSPLRMIR